MMYITTALSREWSIQKIGEGLDISTLVSMQIIIGVFKIDDCDNCVFNNDNYDNYNRDDCAISRVITIN